jgi:hypothetical protein
MDDQKIFQGLNFERAKPQLSSALVSIIAVSLAFTAVWLVLPRQATFLLTLIAVALLTWMASFGWEDALDSLIRFLERQRKSNRR